MGLNVIKSCSALTDSLFVRSHPLASLVLLSGRIDLSLLRGLGAHPLHRILANRHAGHDNRYANRSPSLTHQLIHAPAQVLGFITIMRFADYQFNSAFNPTIVASFAMSVLTNCTLAALTGACHTVFDDIPCMSRIRNLTDYFSC